MEIMDIIKEWFENTLTWLKKNFKLLSTIAFVILTFMLLFPKIELKYIIAICSSYIIILVLQELNAKVLEKEGKKYFPTISKRFTFKNEEGAIRIRQDDIQEIILYLYMIENYLGK